MQTHDLVWKLGSAWGLAVGLLAGSAAIALAEPDPVIRPLLNDIQSELPDDWLVRLPASLPSGSDQLYPYLSPNPQGLTILFGTTQDCATSDHPAACTVGGLAVFPIDYEGWRLEDDRFEPIELADGIEGYTFTRGQGRSINRLLTWEQDNVRYVIGAIEAVVSQDDLLAVAQSMITAPPVVSTR